MSSPDRAPAASSAAPPVAGPAEGAALRVDVWSDIACPWCYVGKRRFERALARFPHAARVELVWRAFELDPRAPAEYPETPSYTQRLADKYGRPLAHAEKMIADMTETARGEGLDFHFERVRGGSTFDAHRVLHLAHARGVQDAVKERFLRGYFGEGASIGQRDVLVRLGGEAGLDEAEVLRVLEEGTYAEDVRRDQAEARAIGVSGVPFFVLGRKYAVSGAQGPDLLLGALTRAFDELVPAPPVLLGDGAPGEGAVCGPEGCA